MNVQFFVAAAQVFFAGPITRGATASVAVARWLAGRGSAWLPWWIH